MNRKHRLVFIILGLAVAGMVFLYVIAGGSRDAPLRAA